MKNNTLSRKNHPKNPRFKQIFRIMRISAFLLMVCVFYSYAGHVYSQNARINIRMSNVKLDKILNEIENQTDYLFIYNNQVDINRKTSVKANNEAVAQVLDRILSGTGINYQLEGTHIILTTKEVNESNALQQRRTISGTVTDINGEPIIGANIRIKGTTIGTITDIDGNFTIGAETKSVIEISYIGYLTQEITINNQKEIRVLLKEDTKTLEEVVVIGYGVQKKADLTGSVANINTEKLTTQSNTNIGQALQGKIAGVDIVSQGGAPGSGVRIMIRGIGTLNNATPLYIVDGMYMNSIDHINPNDIKSIDVLKDASSAAIYGSRAANGVIIVTTKSGSNTEGKPIIDFSANIGVQTPSKYLDMLNANEWSKLTTISRQAISAAPLEMSQNIKEDNNWQNIMMKPALMQNYNVTIRGGTNFFTYYTGLGYVNQDGTIKGTNYKRYNLQFKSEYKRGLFTFGNNVVFSARQNNPLYAFARGGYLGIILQSIPSLQKFDPENDKGGYGKVFGDATDIPNPLGILDENLTSRTSNTYSAYLNLYAELKLPFGMKYRLNVTPDFSFERHTTYENVYDFGMRSNMVSNMQETRYNHDNFLIENLLSLDQSFGKHKLSALLGYSYQKYRTRYIMASGKGLPDGINEVGSATKDRMNDTSKNESALTSIISRVFYSYDNRYLITATYRRDGSSKFAKNNRYGYFPSVSVGWNVSEEHFMKNTRNWLDQFKIRGGYGILGNQEIDNYMYTSVVTSNINYPDGNGGLYSGAFPKDFANPAIRWESTAMTNVGVDLAFLNSRLTVTGDWYRKDTKDILLTVPIPVSTGGANDPIRNAGKIKNTGVEWTIGWNDVPRKDFSYGITFTGNAMKNEVVAMGDANQIIEGGKNRTNVATTRTLAGYPIGGFWLIPTDGLFQSEAEVSAYTKEGKLIQPNAKPGDIRFKDTNNDGKITDADRVYCGSPFPTVTMGLNFNAAWKGFDILLGFQGVFGNKIYNGTRLELEGVNKGTNFLSSTLDYWTPNNPNASHPRLVWDDPNQNTRPSSDRFLENGSFFRMRNIQVGYTFPTYWFKDKVKKCRVYVNAENLFTITDYSGYTPDINNSQSATSRGFDNFIYPINRVFMIGLNLTF
ncbi:MAG: TonB-dependent receptor [Bacteroides heparinolyticus]|nr:TonB-dependent receptor [Bacteroides heparinolyticus]